MRRAAICLLLSVLTGCNDPPRLRTEGEIADIASDAASDEVAPLIARLEELESKVEELQSEQESTSRTADAIADQVANNARIANENAAKGMTRDGACGLEWRQVDGQWLQFNKECRVSDLKK